MNIYISNTIKLFLTALLVLTINNVQAADTPESFTVKLSNPGKPATLNISSQFDQVTVTAEKRNDLVFTITDRSDSDESKNIRDRYNSVARVLHTPNSRQGDRQEHDTTGMQRIESNPGFVVEELNNAVSFNTQMNRHRMHVQVTVPVNTSLRIHVLNGGALTVSGANGTHELSNVNGPIHATDISGSVVAETTNGEVLVTMLNVTKDTPMAFSTTNGSVDVTFPASYRADATLDPGRGATYTDFDINVDKTMPQLVSQQGDRGKRIEVKREIHGQLNGGGPSLRMTTFNGNLYIRKGK